MSVPPPVAKEEPQEQPAAGSEPTSPATADAPSPRTSALDAKSIDEQVHLRSAGLDAPLPVPKEEQGHKNAQEAFPDSRDAPPVSLVRQGSKEVLPPLPAGEEAAADAVQEVLKEEEQAPAAAPAAPETDVQSVQRQDDSDQAELSPVTSPTDLEKPLPDLPDKSPRIASDQPTPEDPETPSLRVVTEQPPAVSPVSAKSPSRGSPSPQAADDSARKTAPSPRAAASPGGTGGGQTPSRRASLSPATTRPGPRRSSSGPSPTGSTGSTSPLSRSIRSDTSTPSKEGSRVASPRTRASPSPRPTVPSASSSSSRLTSPTASSLAKARPPVGAGAPSPDGALGRRKSSSAPSQIRTRSSAAASSAAGPPPQTARAPLTLRGGASGRADTDSAPAQSSSSLSSTGGAQADRAPLLAGDRPLRFGHAAAGRAPAGPPLPTSDEPHPDSAAADPTAAPVQSSTSSGHGDGGRDEPKVFDGFPSGRGHGKIGIPVTYPDGPEGPMKAYKAEELEQAGKDAGQEERESGS
ncbi:hypothetical protein JCM8202_002782 [Rhodotorula sphaerocarpa]